MCEPCLGMVNRGSSLSPGTDCKRDLSAATGHNGEPGRAGIEILATLFLNWLVFVHFTTMIAKSRPKIMSPRAKCLDTSNVDVE